MLIVVVPNVVAPKRSLNVMVTTMTRPSSLNNVAKTFGGSTVEEHLPQHPKVPGLILATDTGIGRENGWLKFCAKFCDSF
jgi:hypothetical protein